MAIVPNGIGVSVQYEHLYIILYKPFFIGHSLCVNDPYVHCLVNQKQESVHLSSDVLSFH